MEALTSQPIEAVLKNFDGLPAALQPAVRNHGGGHANHSLFWTVIGPGAGAEPAGRLRDSLDGAFGSYDDFKSQFTAAATGHFGSGWAWLLVDQGKLAVTSTPNRDSPVMTGKTPLLGLDVGARLVFEVSEPTAGGHHRVLEHRQLGRGGAPVRDHDLTPSSQSRSRTAH